MIENINRFFVKADNVCDYTPLVSTVSNFIDLFQKCVVVPFMKAHAVANSRYYTHLTHKPAGRCLALLIPVIGNVAVGIFDFLNRRPQDEVAILNAIERGDFTGFCDHPKLKENKAFVLEAVRCNHRIFQCVSPNLKADKDVALEAVLRSGFLLSFVDKKLQNDKDVVLAAVQQDPFALRYASEALQKDPDIRAAIGVQLNIKL